MKIIRVVVTKKFMTIAAGLCMVATSAAGQSALMVYRLGVDTLAIEQYTRTTTEMRGEMVQRSGGAVALTTYAIEIGRDGRPTRASIKRMQPDGTPFPNSAVETRFALRADSAVREVVWPDSIQRRAFAASRAMINFPVFVYGPTELLASLQRVGVAMDSVPAIGVGGAMSYTGFEHLGGDTLRMRGAPYAMVLRFDASNRLQLMDGSKTTNKSVATRGSGSLNIAAVARTMTPTGVLSARDMSRAAFGSGGMVIVDYSKPHVRERSVWGGTLVPYDSVWRFGANDATHLMTTRTLAIGGMTLAPGIYTLWVQHTRGGTYLIVNKQTGQWGTQYDATQDVGRVAMQMTNTTSHVEELEISVRNVGGNRGVLEMAWGPSKGSVSFTASVAR